MVMEKFWRDGPRVTTSLFDHIVAERRLNNIDRFLSPNWPDDLHDPSALDSLSTAVERLWRAVEADETIGIMGDYDMDGTPAAALLYEFFRLVGASVVVELPTRQAGYGLTTEYVEKFARRGVSLIVTVDCGIRDKTAVDAATALGMAVIITDHHEPPEEVVDVPSAFAIVNPNFGRRAYPFLGLAGAGVAAKLVDGLIRLSPHKYQAMIPANWFGWELDLVALATIADMVPLIGENRLFACCGLKIIRAGRRPGLRRLIETVGLTIEAVTYRDVAYKIIPPCNAAGRIDRMDDVFTLLVSRRVDEIDAAIGRIMTCWERSQSLTGRMVDEGRQKLDRLSDRGCLVADAGWHAGLTGVVAGRLAEERRGIVAVLAPAGAGVYRGSIRGIAGSHLPELLGQFRHLLVAFGGHPLAAGLTIKEENIPQLAAGLADNGAMAADGSQAISDGLITPGQTTLEALGSLERLEPWGVGNIEPTWSLRQVVLRDVRWLKDGAHLRAAALGEGIEQVPIIYFGAHKAKTLVDGSLDIYGTLGINEFRGNRSPQMIVKGMARHGQD